MAVIRCPNCGKPNPEFLEACQYCDTPLPGGGVGAVPAHRVSSNDDTLIRPPVWDTPADQPAAAPAQPVEPAEPADAEPDDTPPDWMARLRTRQEEAAPEPDWMWTGALTEPKTPAPDAAPSAPAAEVPAYTPTYTPAYTPAAPPPAPVIEPEVADIADLPPWLAGLSGDDVAATGLPTTPDADLPAWMKTGPLDETPLTQPGPSDVTMVPRPKRKMTDWLNAVKAEVAHAAADSTPDSEMPAGPAAPTTGPLSSAALPAEPAPPPADDVPDWLQKLRGSPTETQPSIPTGTSSLGARTRLQEMPERVRPKIAAADPLIHRQTDLEPPPSEPPPPAESPAAPEAAADMPGWLRNILVTQTAAPAETPEAEAPAESAPASSFEPPASAAPEPPKKKKMTDWLGSVLDRPTEPVPEDELMPSWLQSLSAETTAQAPAADPADMPDWLRAQTSTLSSPDASPGVSSEPAAEGEALPDWMTHLQTSDSLPDTPSAPPAEPLRGQPAALGTGELPSWLSTLASVSEETGAALRAAGHGEDALPSPAAPEPAAFHRSLAPKTGPLPPPVEPALAQPEEMPDWMKAMAPPSVEPATDLPVADMPAWMSQLESPESVADTQTPDPFAPPAAPPAPSEEMPEWLRAMAPPSEAPAMPSAPAMPPVGRAPTTPTLLTPPVASMDAGPVSGDMPDWLRAMAPEGMAPATPSATPSASVAPPAAAPPAEGEMPDWMRHLTPVEPAAAAPPAPPAKASSELQTLLAADRPDYLRGLRPGSPPPATPEETAEAAEDVPEWLKSLGDAPFASEAQFAGEKDVDIGLTPPPLASPASETAGAAEPATQPLSWLRPSAPAAPPAPAAAEKAAADRPSEPADIANWLTSLAHPELAVPVPSAPPAPPASSAPPPSDLPAWLQSADADQPAAGSAEDALAWLEASQPAASSAAADDTAVSNAATAGSVPEWLRALRTEPAGVEETSPDAMPDWLRSLRGLPPRVDGPAAADAEADEQLAGETIIPSAPITVPKDAEAAGLQPNSLPDWLAAMRPIDIASPGASEADSYEETLGVLAGMRGVLRAEPAVAQPHTATPATQALAISATHASQAQLLADLAQADATRAPARHVPARMAALAERWIIFAVLAIAIWLAQFQFPWLFPLPATISPETLSAYTVVGTLPTDKPALMAFDYDAAQQGELSPGASVIATHLLSRGVPVVALSLAPTGAGVGQQVLTSAAAALAARTGATLTYGSQYLNLGYLSGGPIGLLQFAGAPRGLLADDFTGAYRSSPLWDAPALRSIQQLSDFGLIVLVSGSPDDTRNWIEQAKAFAPNVPTVALVSAGAEPMVRPYYEAAGSPLDGLVVGVGGAAQYERQANVTGEAASRWPAMGGGLLAAAVLIALGGLISAGLGGVGVMRRRMKR